jgi:hypothetical protein
MFFCYFGLSTTISKSGSDPSIREFSHPCTVWEQDILLPISKFNGLNSRLLDSLNCAIREDTFLLAIFKNTFDRSVRETKNNLLK